MNIVIENPGIYLSVRGKGHAGMQDQGFAPGGAMDMISLRTANLLVGNPEEETAFECTLFGPSMVFNAPCVIALTGADMEPELNGVSIPMYRKIFVGTGWELTAENAKDGCRMYIAVRGGAGKETGEKLKSGDLIPIPPADRFGESIPEYFVPEKCRICRNRKNPLSLRAISGPQEEALTEEGEKILFSSEYIVTEKSNRMGIRLSGTPVALKAGADIISDGIPAGAVQISSSGLPIIMMNDRQTIGGYVKAAVVISSDLPLLAQARPGDAVVFRKISVKDAQEELICRNHRKR